MKQDDNKNILIQKFPYFNEYLKKLPGLKLICCEFCVCRGQAEKEFRVEVEAIGKVRHKHLVGLIGYCAEGARRYIHMKIWLCYSAFEWKIHFFFLLMGAFFGLAGCLFMNMLTMGI